MKYLSIALAVGVCVFSATSSFASKSDDTLNWATDREVAVVDPYYNNTRELVVMGQMGLGWPHAS